MIHRKQKLAGLGSESAFLWGARQTGKSTLLKQLFPGATTYDLLLSDEYGRLQRSPQLLREEILSSKPVGPVIIDEVQRIPDLLNEVQWLMVNHNIPFVLCGSSARKLKKTSANMLGGRAFRYELFPFVSSEIPDFDLLRALNHGLLPRHYLAKDPSKMLQAYIGDYLREEIAAEALTRNIPAFSRFIEVAAHSNGKIINHLNIARECGVSSPTVKEYFQILVDTLIARFVPVFQKRPKRRVIHSPRFYLFDVGLANQLLKRKSIEKGSESFGRAFEHFIFQELTAHSHYSDQNYPIFYWRSASGLEVDFILGDREIAIEVKGTEQVSPHHTKGLRAFMEEYTVKKAIVVSLDPKPRLMDNIQVLPWRAFLTRLWEGAIL